MKSRHILFLLLTSLVISASSPSRAEEKLSSSDAAETPGTEYVITALPPPQGAAETPKNEFVIQTLSASATLKDSEMSSEPPIERVPEQLRGKLTEESLKKTLSNAFPKRKLPDNETAQVTIDALGVSARYFSETGMFMKMAAWPGAPQWDEERAKWKALAVVYNSLIKPTETIYINEAQLLTTFGLQRKPKVVKLLEEYGAFAQTLSDHEKTIQEILESSGMSKALLQAASQVKESLDSLRFLIVSPRSKALGLESGR